MKTKFILLFLLSLSSLSIFAQEDAKKDPTVFITASGKKYHNGGCTYLKGGGIEKKLSEVQDAYSPCSRCFGNSKNVSSSPAQNFSGGSTSTPASKPSKSEVESGSNTKSGATIYTGPRGGQYHYSKSGKKVYQRKK